MSAYQGLCVCVCAWDGVTWVRCMVNAVVVVGVLLAIVAVVALVAIIVQGARSLTRLNSLFSAVQSAFRAVINEFSELFLFVVRLVSNFGALVANTYVGATRRTVSLFSNAVTYLILFFTELINGLGNKVAPIYSQIQTSQIQLLSTIQVFLSGILFKVSGIFLDLLQRLLFGFIGLIARGIRELINLILFAIDQILAAFDIVVAAILDAIDFARDQLLFAVDQLAAAVNSTGTFFQNTVIPFINAAQVAIDAIESFLGI